MGNGLADKVRNFAWEKLQGKIMSHLERIREQAKQTLIDEIYQTVYLSYKSPNPILYGKRVLKDGTVESGRTWQLLNSVVFSDFSIENGKLTFSVYLDASKMKHFSGRDPSKKVYIARYINYGHFHPRKSQPHMYNTYPRRLFIESAMKRIKEEINRELQGIIPVEVTKIGWKSR